MVRLTCFENLESLRRDQLFGSLIRLIERLPESGSLGPACEPIGVEGALGPADEGPLGLPGPDPPLVGLPLPPGQPFEPPEVGFPTTTPLLG